MAGKRISKSVAHQLAKPSYSFPDFNVLDYEMSMARNLNYYNIEIDDNKTKRTWCLDYWNSLGKNITGFTRVSDGYFSTIGALSHMKDIRDIELRPEHLSYLDRKYHELKELIPAKEPDDIKISNPVVPSDDSEFYKHFEVFSLAHDDFLNNSKNFDCRKYLKDANVKYSISKRISQVYKTIMLELVIAYDRTDEQIEEAYSHLSRPALKRYISFIQALIDSCDALGKITRKPRSKVVKSPSEVVKKVLYALEDSTTGIKSIHPSKIIDSTEVWLYNFKIRRVFKYTALSDMKLTVKGSTIMNFDMEKSSSKIIRKPEEQMSIAAGITGSRVFNKFYADIKSSCGKVTGRISKDVIIVKCF